jgi:hypothetical protein
MKPPQLPSWRHLEKNKQTNKEIEINEHWIGTERKIKNKKNKRSSRQGFGAHNLRHVLFWYESLSHSCAHFFARSNRGLAPDNPHTGRSRFWLQYLVQHRLWLSSQMRPCWARVEYKDQRSALSTCPIILLLYSLIQPTAQVVARFLGTSLSSLRHGLLSFRIAEVSARVASLFYKWDALGVRLR